MGTRQVQIYHKRFTAVQTIKIVCTAVKRICLRREKRKAACPGMCPAAPLQHGAAHTLPTSLRQAIQPCRGIILRPRSGCCLTAGFTNLH